jgi:hypothetical protein
VRDRAAFVIVFASLVITTLPALVRLPRRPRVNGTLVEDVERVKRAVPASESLALITKREADPALFAAYYLYPRRTRIYASGLTAYRNADVRTRPRAIVLCDYDHAHLATYEELRAAELGENRVMHGALAPAPPAPFIIPFVASLEGPVTDRYVIEADFENVSGTLAELRMTMMPFGVTKSIAIAPRSMASFNDLVVENFHRTDMGWLRVDCNQPLHAAVWLVNRGRNEGVRVPLVTAARGGVIRCPGNDCVLRLVNFSDRPATAKVNGTAITISPNAMVSQPLRGEANISGGSIYAFAGTRGGKMEIVWP